MKPRPKSDRADSVSFHVRQIPGIILTGSDHKGSPYYADEVVGAEDVVLCDGADSSSRS